MGRRATPGGRVQAEESVGDSALDDSVDAEVDNEVEEDAVESARRAFDEIAAGAVDDSDGDSSAEEAPSEETATQEPPPGAKVVRPAGRKADAPVDDNEEFDPALIPPSRLDDEGKELFKRLPKGLKIRFGKAIRDLEGLTTRTQQEFGSRFRAHQEIDEVIRPHVAHWTRLGHTKASAIGELIATQEALIHPDLKVRKQMLRQLAEQSQVPLDALVDDADPSEKSRPVQNISQDPEFVALRDSVNSITQREEKAVIARLTEQMRAVQYEKDPATGQYVRPRLHDGEFLEACKPLVARELANVAGLTHGEALARVHDRLVGRPTPGISSVRTGLSTPPNSNQRATAAAVSVRGRSRPVAAGIATPDDVPDDATATAAMALEMLRRGAG